MTNCTICYRKIEQEQPEISNPRGWAHLECYHLYGNRGGYLKDDQRKWAETARTLWAIAEMGYAYVIVVGSFSPDSWDVVVKEFSDDYVSAHGETIHEAVRNAGIAFYRKTKEEMR